MNQDTMPVPSLHINVPPMAMFATMLLDVGLVTFGDPAAFGAPSLTTPVFKSVLAMLGVALSVMTAGQRMAGSATPRGDLPN